ncbi:hypothetical protein ACFYY2_34440 [Streptomyces sp. NPDC001822]|uniref:hypothetical protein n=1 Tax=Streptomyces sp. NPDC001822 TaxID=3364614 RepID=UPI0036C129A5
MSEGLGTVQKTWFEVVFRRRPHPALRVLGNLLVGGVVIFGIIDGFRFHGLWRRVALTIWLLGLVFVGRGMVVAVQDLVRRGDERSQKQGVRSADRDAASEGG